jgi:GntR family transcriptional repressor for pyruvate dehydrogenase complex
MIETGQLKVGDDLPAERDLAEQLGVGRNTVREARRIFCEHRGKSLR